MTRTLGEKDSGTRPAGHRRRRRKRSSRRYLVMLLLGVLILLYPVAATMWNDRNLQEVAELYARGVEQIRPSERVSGFLNSADDYNAQLAREGHPPRLEDDADPVFQRYLSELNAPETSGIMARLMIPTIDVDLPVYHTTSDEVLYHGAGHMYGSDLPIGGLGTNSVITAHTGMVNATMFDHLGDLRDGDDVHLSVMGARLTYRVTGREVVSPDDYSAVTYVPDLDKITLITCTPYGINSDRLLVTAERVPTPATEDDFDGAGYKFSWWMIADLILVTIILISVIIYEARKWVRRRSAAARTGSPAGV